MRAPDGRPRISMSRAASRRSCSGVKSGSYSSRYWLSKYSVHQSAERCLSGIRTINWRRARFDTHPRGAMRHPERDQQPLSRRDAIKLGVGAGALLTLNRIPAFALPSPWGTGAPLPLIERAIPSTGEKLPVVGIGTARSYENPTPEEMPVLKDVLKQFPELGGKLLDTDRKSTRLNSSHV